MRGGKINLSCLARKVAHFGSRGSGAARRKNRWRGFCGSQRPNHARTKCATFLVRTRNIPFRVRSHFSQLDAKSATFRVSSQSQNRHENWYITVLGGKMRSHINYIYSRSLGYSQLHPTRTTPDHTPRTQPSVSSSTLRNCKNNGYRLYTGSVGALN